ncbi:DNA-binding transcriptional regulator GbsR (MarR family) [Flavobacterium sp. S87F.05.LMB.W.Kidney.N]|nr:DNA-binding transcriptional regulator GbsR (MarR family) [Flavobacterium sp. S87F.05.LMB.W.Kidney.N]
MVERMGVRAEKDGYPPAAARILSLLLICDPPFLTFDEIKDTLQLSKSAVSNGISLLEQKCLIEYFTQTGSRKRYFKIQSTAWYEFMKSIVRTQRPFTIDVIPEALAFRSDKHPETNKILKEAKEFTDYMFDQMDAALTKWELKNKIK